MSLVWTDIETTGLDRDNCHILEVACIITDDALNEINREQWTIEHQHAALILGLLEGGVAPRDVGMRVGIDPYVIEMHHKNGLWRDCVRGRNLWNVEEELRAKINAHATSYCGDPAAKDYGQIIKPQLAGSTISFDRGFIEKHLPRANEALHYRNVDVSTLNELGKRFWPEVYAARPSNKDKAHRGMADIEESIRVCKHYLANLFTRDTVNRLCLERGTVSPAVVP